MPYILRAALPLLAILGLSACENMGRGGGGTAPGGNTPAAQGQSTEDEKSPLPSEVQDEA